MHAAASFGLWVKQCRTALDLTQERLAERVGCAVQTIRKIEVGERRPSQTMARRLAQALEIPAEESLAFFQAARREVAQDAPGVRNLTPTSGVQPPAPLPAYPTCFVGREQERAELARLLADPACRLITVVGAGGMGKTRLAVEAARQHAAPGHPVAFVPLAPVSSAALLAPAIADALSLRFYGPEPPAQQLLNYLREKDLLLLLDNMEHLLDGVALVAAIMEQAPGVTLLVTSRERLNLQGEWVADLPGLPIWRANLRDEHPDADAVVLFEERARQVQHDFQLTVENGPVVRRICRLLEGMPLGIELAATWVRVLSCGAIAEELERSLDFLQATIRDIPERHRSVRAVFEHSWQLLDAAEQRVLSRLTVFRGGFDRMAAAQIAGASLPLLAALVDKSLVRKVGAERFDLHEVVRQYAAEHLVREAEEQAATQDQHCAYFAALLEEREQPLKSGRQRATVAELTVEIDNLRQAWHWAALRRRLADMRQAIPTLYYFYEIRGSYAEAADLFRQAAAALEAALGTPDEMGPGRGEDERLLLGDLLAIQAWFAFRHGQSGQASDLLQRSLALLGPRSTEAALSTSLPYLWMLRPGRGDYAAGRQLLHQRVDLVRARGDQWRLAFSLLHLGILSQFQGDHAGGYGLMREALVPARMTGDPIAVARILGLASGAAYEIGAYEEAQRLAEECITLNRETGDRFSKGLALNALGLVAHAQGQYLEACSRLEESLALFKDLGDRWHIARALSNLGHALQAVGASADAYQTFLAALETAVAAKTLSRELDTVIGLATLLRDQRKAEHAAELCLHLLRHPAASPQIKDQAGQLWAELLTLMPVQQIVAIEERVRVTPLEAAVADLLQMATRRRSA